MPPGFHGVGVLESHATSMVRFSFSYSFGVSTCATRIHARRRAFGVASGLGLASDDASIAIAL